MTIGTYSAGDVLSADSLNSFGNVTIVRQTRNIPNNSNTTIDFTGGELVDVGGWYSNSSAIQPNVTGGYLLTANSLNLNSSSGRGLINLFVDSTIVASSDDNDGAHDLSLAAHYPITSGEQVTLQCFQNSGSTKTGVTFMLSCQLIRKTA